MTTKTRVSLEDFLRLDETKPGLELIDGEVVQKSMPSLSHGTVVAELLGDLVVYLRSSREGRVVTEVRHADRPEEWVFLPDVSVTLEARRPAAAADVRGPVDVMPDFAIEVLSPDDKPGRISQKIAHYMRSGVRLLWVIDPETERVTIWQPDEAPRLAAAGDILTAEPVLAAFTLDLAALFEQLHS